MQEIVFLTADDLNKEKVDQFYRRLEGIFFNKTNLKKLKYKDHKSVSNVPAIALFDENSIDALELVIGERNAKILIVIEGPKQIKLINDFHHILDRVYGFIDLSQDDFYNVPIVSNYMAQIVTFDSNKLSTLSSDLSVILAQTMKELDSVKKMHREIVPMRIFKNKIMHSTAKFLSGEKPGGEFFDGFSTDSEHWFFYLRSNSYLVASLLIAEIDDLKTNFKNPDCKENFWKKLIQLQKEHGSSIECVVTRFDFKNLDLDIWNQSSAIFSLDGKTFLEEAKASLNEEMPKVITQKLKPDSTYVFLSSGIKQVYAASFLDSRIEDFVKENYLKDEREFLNELFFNIKSKNPGLFLPMDAMCLIGKIDHQSIYQV